MKIALIVQRFGSSVLGGSESLARHYAQLLSTFAEVEVLTTCALDHNTWRNHFPPGLSVEEGISVRRFIVDRGRESYWNVMCRLLGEPVNIDEFSHSSGIRRSVARDLAALPYRLQQEIVLAQGPVSGDLFDHLRLHHSKYDALLFFTYLYPPCYVGMQLVPAEKTYFCPTLHREPMAYLPVYRESFRRARSLLFLTHAERRFAENLHGVNRGVVIGMAIDKPDLADSVPSELPANYLLYSGRIEPPKGISTLLENFLAYKSAFPGDLKLVLMGRSSMHIPRHPDIMEIGYVEEATKFAVMREARALVQPSPFESFSIVVLESLRVGTPVLVNGSCPPLAEHVRRSGAGCKYNNSSEFIKSVHALADNPDYRKSLASKGQRYVDRYFSAAKVTARLRDAFTVKLSEDACTTTDVGECLDLLGPDAVTTGVGSVTRSRES